MFCFVFIRIGVKYDNTQSYYFNWKVEIHKKYQFLLTFLPSTNTLCPRFTYVFVVHVKYIAIETQQVCLYVSFIRIWVK